MHESQHHHGRSFRYLPVRGMLGQPGDRGEQRRDDAEPSGEAQGPAHGPFSGSAGTCTLAGGKAALTGNGDCNRHSFRRARL
jgi:hypothetical protein